MGHTHTQYMKHLQQTNNNNNKHSKLIRKENKLWSKVISFKVYMTEHNQTVIHSNEKKCLVLLSKSTQA